MLETVLKSMLLEMHMVPGSEHWLHRLPPDLLVTLPGHRQHP